MNRGTVKKLTLAAVMLALTIVFQNLRLLIGTNPVSTYIISSLVNLCLIIATGVASLWGGLAIALVAPLIALIQGHAQAPMVPWIIGGNMALVLLYFFVFWQAYHRKQAREATTWRRYIAPWAIATVVAAVVKFAIIALGNAVVMGGKQSKSFTLFLTVAATAQLQQLITAIIAAVIAWLVYPTLEKVVAKY